MPSTAVVAMPGTCLQAMNRALLCPAATQEGSSGSTPINSLPIHYYSDLKVPGGHSSGMSCVTLLEFCCSSVLTNQGNFYPVWGNREHFT